MLKHVYKHKSVSDIIIMTTSRE